MIFNLDQLSFGFADIAADIQGEVYNAVELCQRFSIAACGEQSCAVIPALYGQLGAACMAELEGCYAGVLSNRATRELFSIRDFMGQQPLFMVRTGSQVQIVSTLKSLDRIDDFIVLPPGITRLDLASMTFEPIVIQSSATVFTDKSQLAQRLHHALSSAVAKRLPAADQPVGLFLSGGLDSSILASIMLKLRPDTQFYTLGDAHSADLQHVEQLVRYLGIKALHRVAIPHVEQLPTLFADVVFATESFNPSIVSNGLCSYLLARAARDDGVSIVMSGEGADELFCGYHSFTPADDWPAVRTQLLADISFTELRRIHLTSTAQGVENRCPYLDGEVRALADHLSYSDFYSEHAGAVLNKFILRQAFASELPADIVWRQKVSTDVGSGVRGLVVKYLQQNGLTERHALYAIWQKVFAALLAAQSLHHAPYFSAYPVFDQAIDQRGVTHK